MTTGIQLIAAERERQQLSEGWSPEHDDEHTNAALAKRAAELAAIGTDMETLMTMKQLQERAPLLNMQGVCAASGVRVWRWYNALRTEKPTPLKQEELDAIERVIESLALHEPKEG